jgi:hypothetical protein
MHEYASSARFCCLCLVLLGISRCWLAISAILRGQAGVSDRDQILWRGTISDPTRLVSGLSSSRQLSPPSPPSPSLPPGRGPNSINHHVHTIVAFKSSMAELSLPHVQQTTRNQRPKRVSVPVLAGCNIASTVLTASCPV